MNPHRLRKLWDQASKEKTSVESYKLFVELAQEVLDLLEKTTDKKVDQPKQALARNPQKNTAATEPEKPKYSQKKVDPGKHKINDMTVEDPGSSQLP